MIKNELIVRGGLGNQLFIILESYRLKLNGFKCVSLNLSEYCGNKRVDRNFLVDKLLPGVLDDFRVSGGLISRIKFYIARAGERFMTDQPSDLRLPGDKVLNCKLPLGQCIRIGYFQFVDSNPIDMTALEQIRSNFSLQAQSVSAYSNRLAVHIRRGDYLHEKHKMHGIIGMDDLYNEVKHALTECKFHGITLFSDSPELLDIDRFKSLGVNIAIDEGGDVIEVIKRMSSHEGIIASNSTFSLWAGLLGRPKYFSLPKYWMPNILSSRLGLAWVRRYPCTL